jgi:hypothetical protein
VGDVEEMDQRHQVDRRERVENVAKARRFTVSAWRIAAGDP